MMNSSLWLILYKMRLPLFVLIIAYTISMIGLISIDGVDTTGKIYHLSIFDAFYIITYTATTIGFGESPFAWTYEQKIWMTFSVYLIVLSWFYSVGVLIGLLKDKLFLKEMAKVKFKRQISSLKKDFIIILGYSNTTKQIIKEIISDNILVVIIEKEQEKINSLILEDFKYSIPILQYDVFNSYALELAGICKNNCKNIISLFEDANLNLRIAITAKILNPNINIITIANTLHDKQNLEDAKANIVITPFNIIASHIDYSIKAPSVLKLQRWLYGFDLLNENNLKLPSAKFIISGAGRFGYSIGQVLTNNNIDIVFIEYNHTPYLSILQKNYKVIMGNSDDREILIKSGIKDASVIIAGTNSDTINLSILLSAKSLNPDIITIARENKIDDFLLFQKAQIDQVFMPLRILINKVSNIITQDLSDKLIDIISSKDELWATKLIKQLIQTINTNPILLSITINKSEAFEAHKYLLQDKQIKLEVLCRSRRNYKQLNNTIPLLIQRDDEFILLPKLDELVQIDDKILFGVDENAKDDIINIVNNFFEFYYVLNGFEKRYIWRKK